MSPKTEIIHQTDRERIVYAQHSRVFTQEKKGRDAVGDVSWSHEHTFNPPGSQYTSDGPERHIYNSLLLLLQLRRRIKVAKERLQGCTDVDIFNTELERLCSF